MQNTVDYRVSVHELFSFEPFIECYCLAGWSGKDKIITEITEIRQLDDRLEPGTLMAINLSSIDANHPSLKINSSLSGILLFGSSLPSLPTGLIEKAERYKIPLIHTPIEDGFLEAKSLWDFIEDLKKRNKFLHFARSSFYYSIKEKNQSEILAFLENSTNNPTVIVNNAFQVVNTSLELGYENNDYPAMLLRLIYEEEKKSYKKEELQVTGRYKTLNIEDGNIGYLIDPLFFRGHHYGFIITLELNNQISSLDRIFLDESRKIILEQLVSRHNIDDIEKKYKTDFIHDLLFNNFESKEEVINRGKHWGFDLTQAQQLFVFQPESNSKKTEEAISKIQSIMIEIIGCKKCNPILGHNQDKIVMIIPQSCFKDNLIDKKSTVDLANRFRARMESCIPNLLYSIGIGRYYPAITDLCRSFQEAKMALELGRLMNNHSRVNHFEDLGVMRLLSSIDFFQLDDYYKEYLDEIIRYDQQYESNLLETLIMYFKYNGDINTVAQKMFIHSNSLRYRLRKIEELTQVDLKNYDDILNLFIACKISTMYTNR